MYLITENVSTDQHHFDNPVYAYQTVSKSQPNLLDNALNNGMTIRNNLHAKDKNRHWEKMGFTFDDESEQSLGRSHLMRSESPFK